MTEREPSPADAGSDRSRETSAAPGGGSAAPPDPSAGAGADYAGPGAWGTWAMVLLAALLLIATAATVHSIVITFTG